MPRLRCLLLSLGIASSASAVTMDWTFVGDPGNACDPQAQGCFGAVDYAYHIGTYEVTNAQYVEFLNAKAAADPLELYHPGMASPLYGGITRSGSDGSYTYSVMPGREDIPVSILSFFDTLRFANWMHNGQGNGDTETGAYTLLGGTPTPSNGATVTRNAGAIIALSSEDEWYKAAYYDPVTSSYFDYPGGSDHLMNCFVPTDAFNRANCGNVVGVLTAKGSYTGSASPYGTFDQGGNAWEWNEEIIVISEPHRGIRGGGPFNVVSALEASTRGNNAPANADVTSGFRVAMLPEPGNGLLVVAGLLGLAGWRRARD